MNVEDFIKLMKLEDEGHWIYYDDNRVFGLNYDDTIDPKEFILSEGCTDGRELCCTFLFEDDRYGTVQTLDEYKNGKWEVMKPTWIEDWRNFNQC